MDTFESIPLDSLEFNPFTEFGTEWALVTAGDPASWNTMTVAWGGFGVMWNKNVIFSVIRPSRYTYEFMERCESFTLSFFPESFKEVLTYCGSHSGRDVDKAKETGLTPMELKDSSGGGSSSVGFKESRLAYLCRKIYNQDFDPGLFLDTAIESHYPEKDYHRLYVGEIVQVFRGSGR